MQSIEGLGVFYLGRKYDLAAGEATGELILYDAKDLTTHAVCVGMTGSGKTGLCLTLLEEAAIDGVPAIAIDPKGDLGNLLLAFPELRPADFRPWVDPTEAARKGQTPDEYATQTAKTWAEGLEAWQQDGGRIQRFKDAVDIAIYTPGSSAGLPLTVLRSFKAPSAEVLSDTDALRQRISSAASGLLALLGIDADPIRSREHILLSNILDTAWRSGKNLDIAGLIRDIQTPPMDKVGFLDLESFFPARERAALAMSLNNLLASPGFAGWLEGEPLDVQRLLYTPQGKPRLSIISIAHLSEAERMFLVTILLNEVLAWVRGQPGTSSLRALLYMDEVFGYFPPTANPPSKQPMLTLLKQARAYGLGIVLATQNPVDLDYKGLANAGTWFLGRLQTERDKQRVLEGLEGASAAAGSNFDRQKMEATLAALKQRVFLMNNVHDDEPVVFQTRWALSYLRGPLTRGQIQALMAPRKAGAASGAGSPAADLTAPPMREAISPPAASVAADAAETNTLPVVPATIVQRYLRLVRPVGTAGKVVYRPALVGLGRVHYVSSPQKVDHWQSVALLADAREGVDDDPWAAAKRLASEPEWDAQPRSGATFADLPAGLVRESNYKAWSSELKSHLHREHTLTIFSCAQLKEFSRPGESEGDFRVRLRQQAVEARDLQIEKLRKSIAPKIESLQGRIRAAQERVEREKAQSRDSIVSSGISIFTTVVGAMFGRKLTSATNIGKAGTAARSISRASRERGDVGRAQDKLEDLQDQLAELEAKFEDQIARIKVDYRPEQIEIQPVAIPPRKSDITVSEVALAWCPWVLDRTGSAEPGYRVE